MVLEKSLARVGSKKEKWFWALGPVSGLKKCAVDIDWKNGVINILDPKFKSTDVSYVYLTPDIKKRLQKYDVQPGEYLFKNRNGEKVREVSDIFERVIKKLGFNDGITDNRQKLTFHSLRHTFASWLALSGEQLPVIKELMRHKNINMTMRYAHLIPSHKRRAVEKIAAYKF